MSDASKTKAQLIADLAQANRRIETSEQRYRRAEETLRILQENTSRYLDLARVIIVSLDDKGHVATVCGKCKDILGYKPEELLGQDWFRLCLPEDDIESNKSIYRALMAHPSENVEYFENEVLTKSGSRRRIAWHNTLILDENNAVIGTLSSGLDITDRKKQEEKVSRFSRIFERSLNEIFIFNADTLRFENVNRGARENLGYSMAELFDMTPLGLMLGQTPESFARLVEPLRDTTVEKIQFEAVHRRKDGSAYPVEFHLQLMLDGAPAFVAIVLDISDRRQAEEQIRRVQKMDALGKLTGGIAHDYNNMLGVILGYSKLLQGALIDNPGLSQYIDEIYRASERGRKLSRKLLAFSRVKQPEASVSDVNAVLLGAQDFLQKTLTPAIALKLELVANVWLTNIDTSELEDAIFNLAINAKQAMGASGALTITTANQSYNAQEHPMKTLASGDYVQLSIKDTGSGIDAAVLGKIFDPFFTTKGTDGVGLGLSMVYGLVRRSGGDIAVSSSRGTGTQFTLYFPRCRGSLSVTNTNVEHDTSGLRGDESVLVVDDESALVGLTREILQRHGYFVVTASSGEEALIRLSEQKFDLLISDVVMPVMDGFDLAQRVQRGFPDVKIQLISGYAEAHAREGELTRLEETMLYKPVPASELLRRVRDVLNERVSSDSSSFNHGVILVMDDDENVRELFRINLNRLGYKVRLATDGMEAITLYKKAFNAREPYDAVFLDLAIPGGMGGCDAANGILAVDPNARLVVTSGYETGDVMSNYQSYGFSAAISKTFDRDQIEYVLNRLKEFA